MVDTKRQGIKGIYVICATLIHNSFSCLYAKKQIDLQKLTLEIIQFETLKSA